MWDGTFEQIGVQRVSDIPELFQHATLHTHFDPPDSQNVCIASTSGGLASLLADLASGRGLNLPAIEGETEQTLLEMEELLTFGLVNNPADIRGYGADILPRIADTLFADDRFDAYLFAIGLSAVDDRAEAVADAMIDVAEAADDPVVYLWTGRKKPQDHTERPLPYERVRQHSPLFYDPERSIDALASFAQFGAVTQTASDRPTRGELISRHASRTGPAVSTGTATWTTATDVLEAYEIDTVETIRVTDAIEAREAAQTLGYPVVLKVDSTHIPHRTDVNGVRVGLTSAGDVELAYKEIIENVNRDCSETKIDGVLIQPQIDGVEGIIGVVTDEVFGPVVSVGPGGTIVEALEDRSLLIPPFTTETARDAIERTILGELLAGHRDSEGGDIDTLAELLVNVGILAYKSNVDELDLNPVFVTEEGCSVVDILLVGE